MNVTITAVTDDGIKDISYNNVTMAFGSEIMYVETNNKLIIYRRYLDDLWIEFVSERTELDWVTVPDEPNIIMMQKNENSGPTLIICKWFDWVDGSIVDVRTDYLPVNEKILSTVKFRYSDDTNDYVINFENGKVLINTMRQTLTHV